MFKQSSLIWKYVEIFLYFYVYLFDERVEACMSIKETCVICKQYRISDIFSILFIYKIKSNGPNIFSFSFVKFRHHTSDSLPLDGGTRFNKKTIRFIKIQNQKSAYAGIGIGVG